MPEKTNNLMNFSQNPKVMAFMNVLSNKMRSFGQKLPTITPLSSERGQHAKELRQEELRPDKTVKGAVKSTRVPTFGLPHKMVEAEAKIGEQTGLASPIQGVQQIPTIISETIEKQMSIMMEKLLKQLKNK